MTQERVLGQRPNSLMVNFMGSSRRTGEQGGGADCSRGREFKPSPAPGQTELRSMALSQNSRANKQTENEFEAEQAEAKKHFYLLIWSCLFSPLFPPSRFLDEQGCQ